MSRRPALDGLRAFAVLAVMAFHTSPAAHGGFLGVDVFFVISGYLITALLLREWARTERIDLKAFYLRRGLRLLPALLFMLAVTLPFALTWEQAELTVNPVAAVASVLFYVANWASVGVDGSIGIWTHTWSLSIEEQFYLIWPAVLIVVLARRRQPPARALAAVVTVIVAARVITWHFDGGSWMYYATTSHCDGLLLGSLLAALLDRRETLFSSKGRSEAVAWLGVAGLAALFATSYIEAASTFQWRLPLVALLSAMVVHHLATCTDGPMVRLLSLKPLVGIGAVSYGLYLYHYPVFMTVQSRGFSHPVQHLLEVSLTIGLTGFSWYLVEKPALRLKERLPQVKPLPAHAGGQ
ncbi:acyltransferase family protein [Kineosporia babensis]|uniref:Acyltransferase n=1 Tax=Kineosporia babensis TaxID=499548 RepID=A0A9X1NK19_9ACTN|nr:acyltransferase [Kineosporia babensis]MCD5314553.1 acyltransferase [Kineosporia babensis]